MLHAFWSMCVKFESEAMRCVWQTNLKVWAYLYSVGNKSVTLCGSLLKKYFKSSGSLLLISSKKGLLDRTVLLTRFLWEIPNRREEKPNFIYRERLGKGDQQSTSIWNFLFFKGMALDRILSCLRSTSRFEGYTYREANLRFKEKLLDLGLDLEEIVFGWA